MPKVSYLKAIDVFLLGNFAFIFISLVEYVVVLNTNPECPIKGEVFEKICKTEEGRDNETSEVSRLATTPTIVGGSAHVQTTITKQNKLLDQHTMVEVLLRPIYTVQLLFAYNHRIQLAHAMFTT